MRSRVIILAALGLAACSPRIPDSGGGVGFQDYNNYSAPTAAPAPAAGMNGTFSPDAALAAIDKAEGKAPEVGAPLSALPPAVTPYTPSGSTTPAPSYAQPSYTAPPSYVPPSGERARGNAPAGIVETTSEMTGAAGVSDEQDFQAVTKRETIESDAARIARNRAQYHVDQPTALPQRVGDTGPNIVEYAISTNHPKGTQMYRRSSLRLTSYNAACARYPSPDLAQEAFLAAGGPDKDRKGLDPDGDGYACAWDPTPFRAAVQQ